MYFPTARALEGSRPTVWFVDVLNVSFDARMVDKPSIGKGFTNWKQTEPEFVSATFDAKTKNGLLSGESSNSSVEDSSYDLTDLASLHRKALGSFQVERQLSAATVGKQGDEALVNVDNTDTSFDFRMPNKAFETSYTIAQQYK